MGKMIESNNFNLPPPAALPHTNVIVPNMLIGDEAFALTKNMMKPYPRQQSLLDPSKAIYNYRHSRARRTTENAFGIMSSYFRVFFTPVHVKPETIDKIIMGSCILHNMMRSEKISSHSKSVFITVDNLQMPTENLVPVSNAMGRPTNDGTRACEALKGYFNGIGAVHWQQEMIA